MRKIFVAGLVVGVALSGATILRAQDAAAIQAEIRGIRQVPDAERGAKTSEIALAIRKLPAGLDKLKLASALTSRSTEGDFGIKALTDVAETLAQSLKETPQPDKNGQPVYPYMQLAQLERYEGVKIDLQLPQVDRAMKVLEKNDADTSNANFALKDLSGKTVKFSDLRGKVVLVNFWATWCPPCRKEMPDLNGLQKEYGSKGLVILSITNDDPAKVRQMINGSGYTPTVLLDEGDATWKQFHI